MKFYEGLSSLALARITLGMFEATDLFGGKKRNETIAERLIDFCTLKY